MASLPNVHASGTPTTFHSGTCQAELAIADALSVGLSLRALARDGRMPSETARIYERVGEQLVAAARAAAKNGGVR